MSVGGLAERRRLDEIARLAVHGHLSDPGLEAVVETLAAALRVPMAAINIVTSNLQTYAAEVGIGVPCTTVADDRSFCAEVVSTDRPLIIADAAAHPVYGQNPLVAAGKIGAYAGFPLTHRGVVIGSVCVFDAQAREFTPTELSILAAQTQLASTVLSLRHAATHDGLTGLANRSRGAEFAEQILDQAPTSVLFVDVDDFKSINDQHGHAAGDQVLRGLAARLEGTLEGTGHLAVRWGGDEFLVVMAGADATEAKATAERLLVAVRSGQDSISVSVTVGVATGFATTSLDNLVRIASGEAAKGKRAGKGRVHAPEEDEPVR